MRVFAQNPKEDLVKQDVGLPAEKTDFTTDGNGAVSLLYPRALLHNACSHLCGAPCKRKWYVSMKLSVFCSMSIAKCGTSRKSDKGSGLCAGGCRGCWR